MDGAYSSVKQLAAVDIGTTVPRHAVTGSTCKAACQQLMCSQMCSVLLTAPTVPYTTNAH
jgi:hypothetical protein